MTPASGKRDIFKHKLNERALVTDEDFEWPVTEKLIATQYRKTIIVYKGNRMLILLL